MLYIYRKLIPGIPDVDWHRFDADPDLDPTFNINSDPAPGSTPLEHVGKSELKLTFMHSSASLHCFIFLATVIDVIILNFLGQHVTYIEIFRTKVYSSLALHLVEMETDPDPDAARDPDRQALHLDADPDPPKICRIRIRIHNTANTACNGQGSMQFQFLAVNVPSNLDSRRAGFMFGILF
jgi:hypothetical protein